MKNRLLALLLAAAMLLGLAACGEWDEPQNDEPKTVYRFRYSG